MRDLFVKMEEVKLFLFDEYDTWISVRRSLNAAEDKRASVGALKRMSPSGAGTDAFNVAYDVDFEAAAFSKVKIYLIDWNFKDNTGKDVSIDTSKKMEDALRALDPDVFKEIERVIDAHIESEKEKKAKIQKAGLSIIS